jgi:hypothetical protein
MQPSQPVSEGQSLLNQLTAEVERLKGMHAQCVRSQAHSNEDMQRLREGVQRIITNLRSIQDQGHAVQYRPPPSLATAFSPSVQGSGAAREVRDVRDVRDVRPAQFPPAERANVPAYSDDWLYWG